MDDTADISEIDVDELWLREWVEDGIGRIARYLDAQAAFEAYLRERGDE